jgi:hypothetical protein
MYELKRIGRLPDEELRPALNTLDMRRFGFLKTREECLLDAKIGLGLLRKQLRDLGVDVGDVDE